MPPCPSTMYPPRAVAIEEHWPFELDLIAKLTGFTLEHRWQDWQGRRFGAESTNHISVWTLRTQT